MSQPVAEWTKAEVNRTIAFHIEPLTTARVRDLWQWPDEWHGQHYSPKLAWKRDVHYGTGAWAVPNDFEEDPVMVLMLLGKLRSMAGYIQVRHDHLNVTFPMSGRFIDIVNRDATQELQLGRAICEAYIHANGLEAQDDAD